MIRRIILAVILVISLALMAGCTPRQSGESSSPTVSNGDAALQDDESTTDDDESDNKPLSSDSGDSLDLNDLSLTEKLDSYRATQKGVYKQTIDGVETVTTYEVNQQVARDPKASSALYTTANDEVERTFEVIIIGQDSYMRSSESPGWTAMSIADSGPAGADDSALFTDPTSALSGDARLVGTETVNGLESKHYVYEGRETFGNRIASDAQVELCQADVWVSTEYNVVVRYQAHVVFSDKSSQYDWKFESNLLDVNTPVTIEPPEGVTRAGLPDDVPMIDDASEVSAYGGMVMFSVKDTVEDILEFYAKKLPANGWEKGTENLGAGQASYTKGNRKLLLIVSAAGEESSVTIIVQEQ
ncbi:MAG: hypothetical protein GXY52_00395 [Chloroflexi bacterium]|nr:hypothetical protein [Chloroflexota bacterium]